MTLSPPTTRRVVVVSVFTLALLVVAVVCGLIVGPTSVSNSRIFGSLIAHIGIGHSTLDQMQTTVIWQLRAPRLVLGLLAGAMLAVAGGSYQGVFRNPLADPYLLGVAAGAGIGATFAIMDVGHGLSTPTWTPITFTNNTTNGWNLVSIPGGVLPSSTTLSLRFTQPAVAGQIRIDDIKVFNYNPACTLVLGTPTGVCDAVTSGIDTYTATIPYTGGGTGTYTITPSSGTVSGDNPNTVAAGNIIITGINEGTNLSLTAVNGSCSYSATLTAPECKAVNSLPYSEPFPYTLGSTLGSSQKWTNVNSGDEILSVSPSLTYTGLTSSGNAVSFSGAGIDCHSPFTATTVADLTLYSSFLINVTDYSTITTDGTQDYFAAIIIKPIQSLCGS